MKLCIWGEGSQWQILMKYGVANIITYTNVFDYCKSVITNGSQIHQYVHLPVTQNNTPYLQHNSVHFFSQFESSFYSQKLHWHSTVQLKYRFPSFFSGENSVLKNIKQIMLHRNVQK